MIIAFAAHLKDTCRCSQDHIVDDIFATAKLLNLQMNDILDNMKISKKKLDPKIKVTDLSKVIDETIRIMKPQAHNKSIELISCLPPEPFRIGTDGERVQQILVNLLSNALKFSPHKGQVTVSLTPLYNDYG